MGRELKRVPLDFDWPRGEIWKGYVCPYHSTECKTCDGTGYNPETRKIYESWYSFGCTEWGWVNENKRYNRLAWMYNLDEDDIKALVDSNRLWDFTRVPRTDEQSEIVKKKMENGGNSWLPEDNGYIPTPEEVNEWARSTGMAHDALNCHICTEAKARRLGVYGHCPVCNGHGNYYSDESFRKLAEDWEPFQPPEGEGFQLWETTSEGSPVSPVFETLDELCEWCEDNATVFGSQKTTREQWKNMLGKGFVSYQDPKTGFTFI